MRREISSAAVLYAAIITLSAAFPGLVLNPPVLSLYFLSALIVFLALSRGIAGQFSGSLLQGFLSVLLLLYFGPLQPFVFLMIALHVIVPSIIWHWTDLIESAQR